MNGQSEEELEETHFNEDITQHNSLPVKQKVTVLPNILVHHDF